VANPQCEDGYTKIANEIMEALARIRISGEARQVLDVIFRKIYGFHKLEDAIALSQFVSKTGLKRPTICKAIRKLLFMNLITKKDNGFITTYRIQKDYSLWNPLPKKIMTITQKDNLPLPKKIMTITQKDNLPLPKKIHTKDTLTKDTLTKEKRPFGSSLSTLGQSLTKDTLTKEKRFKDHMKSDHFPEWVPLKEFEAYKKMRRTIRKPLTSEAELLVFKKLERLQAQGYNPIDILNQSILNSWQGIFPIKKEKKEESISDGYKYL
jgi:phage replication O-like protein O